MTVIEKLKEWKEKKDRLPIILLGARQVDKTWLMKEFGRSCFADVCYVNFEEPGDLRDLFEEFLRIPAKFPRFYLEGIIGKDYFRGKLFNLFKTN